MTQKKSGGRKIALLSISHLDFTEEGNCNIILIGYEKEL